MRKGNFLIPTFLIYPKALLATVKITEREIVFPAPFYLTVS